MIQAYKEKFIKDLTREDVKVAVSGIIVDKKENNLVIDDTTGMINAIIETDLGVNKFVRVFGNIIRYNDSLELQGHLIQDLSEVDKELYKKVKSLFA